MAETQTSQPAAEQPAIDPSDPMQRLEQTFPHLSLEMVLPVDRTGVDSRLVVEFSHLANSAAPQEPPDDGLAYDRTIAVFTPVDPPDAD